MKSLVDCMMWMIDPLNGYGVYSGLSSTNDIAANKQPTFITGHSLGGNAATLFAKANPAWVTATSGTKFPHLVTFGAAPNVFRSPYVEDLIACSSVNEIMGGKGAMVNGKYVEDEFFGNSEFCEQTSYTLTEKGYEEYADMLGGIGNYCSQANTDSIRFFHKFDPVPSQAMWKGQYAHGTEFAIMLYDMPDASCDSDVSCAISSGSLGDTDEKMLGFGGSDPYMVKDYLCDKWAVGAKAYPTSCYDGITSYMSLLNPWPCGEIIFYRVWKEEWDTSSLMKIGNNDGTVHVMSGDGSMAAALDFVMLQETMFLKFEEYVDCVEGYEATIGAYYQNAVVDFPEIGGIAFMLFTFTWVHSTYALYPLCTDMQSDGTIEAVNIDSSDIASITVSECTGSELTYCETSVCSSKKDDPWCVHECMMDTCYYASS